jgi:hypothetical protein
VLVVQAEAASSTPSTVSSSKPSGVSSARLTGTVTGTLRLSGGPSPGTNTPTSGVVYAFSSATLTGTPIAKANAGPDGKYHLNLPSAPSRDIAELLSPPPPATPPCHAATPAVVSVGRTSRLDVDCAMK